MGNKQWEKQQKWKESAKKLNKCPLPGDVEQIIAVESLNECGKNGHRDQKLLSDCPNTTRNWRMKPSFSLIHSSVYGGTHLWMSGSVDFFSNSVTYRLFRVAIFLRKRRGRDVRRTPAWRRRSFMHVLVIPFVYHSVRSCRRRLHEISETGPEIKWMLEFIERWNEKLTS